MSSSLNIVRRRHDRFRLKSRFDSLRLCVLDSSNVNVTRELFDLATRTMFVFIEILVQHDATTNLELDNVEQILSKSKIHSRLIVRIVANDDRTTNRIVSFFSIAFLRVLHQNLERIHVHDQLNVRNVESQFKSIDNHHRTISIAQKTFQHVLFFEQRDIIHFTLQLLDDRTHLTNRDAKNQFSIE